MSCGLRGTRTRITAASRVVCPSALVSLCLTFLVLCQAEVVCAVFPPSQTNQSQVPDQTFVSHDSRQRGVTLTNDRYPGNAIAVSGFCLQPVDVARFPGLLTNGEEAYTVTSR